MNTNRLIPNVILAAVLASASGMAAASGSTTVQVTAAVSAVCKFAATTSPAIPLGTIDPSAVTADVTGTSNITYNCTKGTTPTVGFASGGSTRTLTDGTKTIAYSFTLGSPEAGVGFSAAGGSKVVGTATIALVDAQNAAAGTSYADTVTLSINY